MIVKAQPLFWAGEEQGAIRVDDWPNPTRDLKTVMIHTDNFVGTITVQASLYADPGEDDWYDMRVETFEVTAQNAVNRSFNTRDRSIWMRAIVETQHGRVDRIMVM